MSPLGPDLSAFLTFVTGKVESSLSRLVEFLADTKNISFLS
jgi:hypothetical protein